MNETSTGKFLFFEGYHKTAQKIPPERRLAFYEAIITYALYGKPLPEDGPEAAVFEAIKPSLDKSAELANKRQMEGQKGGKSKSEAKKTSARANGKLGGRPPKNPTKPNETQATETETETETETNYITHTQDARAMDEKPNAAPNAAPGAVPAMADTEVGPHG